jgi:NAD(P)H-flavin reductase
MAINPVLIVRRFRIQEVKWETAETYTLVLAPEDANDMPVFKPGQWVYLHVGKSCLLDFPCAGRMFAAIGDGN